MAARGLLAAFVTVAGVAATPAIAQQQPPSPLNQLYAAGEKLKRSIPAQHQRLLSGSGQFLLNLANNKKSLKIRPRQLPLTPRPAPQGYANDPNAPDDFISRFAGNTQSEPSTAWCGKTAVIGYNDTGSFMSTVVNPPPSGAISLLGWSRTTDPDKKLPSYTDMGALIADPPPPGVTRRDLTGDPTLGCSTSNNFYFGSTSMTFQTDGTIKSGISVARSTDGGKSFHHGALAASADLGTHFLDKPMITVEPGPTASPSDDIIHVTYTEFDGSGTFCGGAFRTAIEYVKSTDGGATWTAPQVIDQDCGLTATVFGSLVKTGKGGNVYVAWERYDPDFQHRSIHVRRSVDDGASFGGDHLISPVVPTGDGTLLQGLFRNFVDLQGLAVAPSNKALYVTWNDGRYAQQPDPNSNCENVKKYCFSSVLFSRSTDGGATWSAPTRVNDGPVGEQVDWFQPALDVDSRGKLYSLYYDRQGIYRGVARNFNIQAVVAQSSDGGSSWKRAPVSSRFFPTFMDQVPPPHYMGDYISIATDRLGTYPGAIAAWGDNSLGDANVGTVHVDPGWPKPDPKPHPKPHHEEKPGHHRHHR
ncbi:sialidase family protein [Streptomyces sp. NPDC003233]